MSEFELLEQCTCITASREISIAQRTLSKIMREVKCSAAGSIVCDCIILLWFKLQAFINSAASKNELI